jgi:hypothetical protein
MERVSPTRIASFDAIRPPPQAGEVQQVRGQVDATKNHPAIERFRATHALELDPGVDTGSREENASKKTASVLIQSESRLQIGKVD